MKPFISGLKLPDHPKLRVSREAKNFQRPLWIRNDCYCPIIDDQGQTGMCTAFSFVNGVQAYMWREHNQTVNIDETPLYDDALASTGQRDPTRKTGLMLEDILAVADLHMPCLVAEKVEFTDPADMPWVIHHFGWLYCGLTITEGWFEAGKDGRIRTGGEYDKKAGGHAVTVFGYDYSRDGVMVPNSWGRDYGANGATVLTFKQFADQFVYGYGIRFKDKPDA